MPLSGALRTVDMSFKCPLCGLALVKDGNWFMTVGRFKCEGCQAQIRLSYNDKVELFAEYAHLA
jgi:transposase-like protein